MRIRSVRVRNFLGFGDAGLDLSDLRSREVIVGANGSGKSSVLHAIEFVGKTFKNELTDGRAYVHKGDLARSIQVEVGLDLEPEESRAIGTVLTYGVTSEQGQLNPGWHVSQSALNRMLRAALSMEPRFFDTLVSEQELFLKVSSMAGVGQTLRPALELRSPQGSLYLSRHGTIMTEDRELSGWSGFDFEREVLTEVANGAPTLLEKQPVDLERVATGIAAAVKGWDPMRLISRLQVHGPVPTALRLDPLPAFTDRQDMEGGDPDLIQLRTMLAGRGFTGQQVSLFDLISRVYNWSYISLSDSRSRPNRIPIQEIGVPTDYDPIVTGQGLPLTLFFLKNNLSVEWRNRYAEIQRAFEQLTSLKFDVALNPEYVREPPPNVVAASPSGIGGGPGDETSPLVLRHFPYILFEESGYSFLMDFAASGFFEVLLVLTTSIGPSNCVVLLDEPVLNLHPSKQRELYRFLSERASGLGNQLLIVTHSSTFASVDDLSKAIRFDRASGEAKGRRLQSGNARQTAQTVKELERMPRLLEALFSRGVILVEGGAEASALPIWFEKCQGGEGLSGSGVIFLDVGGDTHFGALKRILDGWGIPFRIVADSKAIPRVKRFGDAALTYPFPDFSELLKDGLGQELSQVVSEVGGSGGERDPAVARVLAFRTSPPPAVVELWEQLKSFVLSG
jgi:AAA domain, putative AbiEii toxin, Type IV TA system/AAA ATPase domain